MGNIIDAPTTGESTIVEFDVYSPKRVSYIVATKNRAVDLQRTLALVREFITPDDELIIVDGRSTDDTRRVVERNADIIHRFISESDVNAAHAVNKGIMLAQGRYIRQVTDDDIVHPAGIEQAIQVMDQHPEVDLMVCGGTKQILDNPPFEVWIPPGVNYGNSTEDVFRFTGTGAGFVIRRNALPLIGLFPPGIAADVGFVLQAIDRGATVRFCRINLFHHPIHEGSYIIKHQNESLKDVYRLLRLYCSLKFYVYYRVHRFFRRIPAWRQLVKAWKRNRRFPQRVWNKAMRTSKIITPDPDSVGASEPKKPERWDGGFS